MTSIAMHEVSGVRAALPLLSRGGGTGGELSFHLTRGTMLWPW